jgi:uncharacterized heparinase superfamily protein
MPETSRGCARQVEALPAAPPRRRSSVTSAETEPWRANPFHRGRLGEATLSRVKAWGADPRVGDATRGRDIVQGAWRFGAERLVAAPLDPWSAPAPSRHFAARLHSFSWLADLAAAPKSDEAVAAVINAWVARFGDWDELAYDPELTAERIFAWLCWGKPAFESGELAEVVALSRAASRQARLLLIAQSELSDRRLGFIKAGAALVLAGAAGFEDADQLLAQGEEMLIEACAKQFLPDGGHRSRGPEALAEAYFDMMTAQAALEAMGEPSAILHDALSKSADMLRMLRLGDGGLGCFHGGSACSSASLDAALKRAPGERHSFQFSTSSAFQRIEADDLVILFDVGGAPAPAYSERAHAGALAFEMSSGAERIIVNVGAARDLEPAARQAARATNGHSTLVLADALSGAFEEQRRGRAPARLSGPDLDDVRRSSDESGVTVQGRHNGYRASFGLMHRRYIFADHAGRNVRGIDELIRPTRLKNPKLRAQIPYVVRFHLHPGVKAQLTEPRAILIESAGGQRWRLRTDAPEINVLKSIYWGGRAPKDCLQIVLDGKADPMGHGLAPPNRIRWALSRSD